MDKPYKIYAEIVEDEAMKQFNSFMEQPWVVKGALMPDVHSGYSLPIGAVIACDGMISPQAVGFDIGCGVLALQTGFNINEVREKSKEIFNQIYRDVPVGFNHNKVDSEWLDHPECTEITRELFGKNGLKQLGTLGGGKLIASSPRV